MADVVDLFPKVEHCADVRRDRALGGLWENNFCVIAAKRHGKTFTAHQIGRPKSAMAFRFHNGYHPLTLPDVTLWSAPGEHHEIKHKRPTEDGNYGLEDYRFKALKWFSDETQQHVYYTIHDWGGLGDRDAKTNREEDWVTADISRLYDATLDGTAHCNSCPSYVAGQKRWVPTWFWPKRLWHPLCEMWADHAVGGHDDSAA